MKARTRSTRVRSACAAAFLVISTLTVISPPAAFSQLGSLIVTVTAPAAGANVSGTIPVSASVTIVGALTVQSVQFKVNGVVIGEDTSAPYSIPWNTKTVSDGQHTVTACARDLLGIVWDSQGVTFRIDNTPPAVAINKAAAQADPTKASPINFTVVFTEPVTGFAAADVAVSGSAGGVKSVAVTGGPTTFNVAVSGMTDGTVVAAVAAGAANDAAGNGNTASASADDTVVFDTTAPVVSVSSPAGGATVAGTVDVTAGASDAVGVVGVSLFVNGAPLGAEDVVTPYTASWNTTGLANGTQHTLTATARDAAGNTAASPPVTVTVSNDTIAPTVTINQATAQSDPTSASPVNFTVVFSEAVTEFTAADVAIAGTAGGTKSVAVTGGPSTYAVAVTGMTDGTLIASIPAGAARDAAGNGNTASTSTDQTVTFDDSGPAVSITSPGAGSTVNGAITVDADASDNLTVVGVQFRLDGAALGAEDLVAPYSVPWDTATAANGAHTLTAVARDAAGNVTTSGAVTVTVSNGSTVRRFEDTDAAVTYTPAGTWSERSTVRAWSGGTAALGFTDAQRATFTFNGTGITWIGFRGPQAGIANVYLDGALAATVDLYAATEELQVTVFTRAGLAAGAHTLVIEVPSPRTKNVASSDYFVVVDAFDVAGAPAGPDTTPPTVAITSPGAGATIAGTVTVTANASDAGGIGGVQFFLDGVMLQAEDTSAPYAVDWDTRTAADGSHTLTAVARDAAGNPATSAPVSVTVSNTAPPPPPPASGTATRFEDTNLAIAYTPGVSSQTWFHGSRSRAWSDMTASFNRAAGARAEFRFSGTSVTWVSFRAPWAGIADVYLDGVFAERIDMYLGAGRDPAAPRCTQPPPACVDEEVQVPVFTRTGLAPGNHTLAIEVTGTRNALAIDNAVVVDGFDVSPGPPPTIAGSRVDNAAPAVAYSGLWTHGETSTSTSAGARASFTFTGTQVSWIGRRGPHTGIARIFLDGAFHAEVDTYASAEIQAVVFKAMDLAPAQHTLTIEVTGLKRASATGHAIVVDAFDVRSRFEETEASAIYTGDWRRNNEDKAWSGASANQGTGTAALSATAGARATFSFSGTGVTWIGYRGPLGGIAEVFVDGAHVARVDLFAPAEELRAAVFAVADLAAGSHVLRIDVTGERNPAATGAFVIVDAFDVTVPSPAPAVTRLQETHSSIAYSPTSTTPELGWAQTTKNPYWSGEKVMISSAPAARATFTFTGTAVRWIGQRGRQFGIARVTLDGGPPVDIDLFGTGQDEFQVAVFSASGLASGPHTLTIEVTGLKNVASDAALIPIDAFDIH